MHYTAVGCVQPIFERYRSRCPGYVAQIRRVFDRLETNARVSSQLITITANNEDNTGTGTV